VQAFDQQKQLLVQQQALCQSPLLCLMLTPYPAAPPAAGGHTCLCCAAVVSCQLLLLLTQLLLAQVLKLPAHPAPCQVALLLMSVQVVSLLNTKHPWLLLCALLLPPMAGAALKMQAQVPHLDHLQLCTALLLLTAKMVGVPMLHILRAAAWAVHVLLLLPPLLLLLPLALLPLLQVWPLPLCHAAAEVVAV
jgi:hypothetical protein